MKRVLKPDQERPAKVNANAGRKQSPLTDEEKILQRKRLMAVSDDEKEQAIKYLGNWITKTMKKWGFNLQNGPFCYEEMNGDAVKVISWDSYCAIYYGERRWPDDIDLKTVLIGVAWSMMDHTVSKYSRRKSHLRISMEDEKMSKKTEQEIEEAVGMFRMEMGMRNLGFEIAIKAVGDNALFLHYLNALKEGNSYDLIAEKMHMTERKVMNVEKKLLKYLSNL